MSAISTDCRDVSPLCQLILKQLLESNNDPKPVICPITGEIYAPVEAEGSIWYEAAGYSYYLVYEEPNRRYFVNIYHKEFLYGYTYSINKVLVLIKQ